jgi:hypothetical protein
MDLISAINYSGLMAEYAISAEKDNLGNVISSTYGKKTNDVYYIRPTNQYSAYSTTASYQINDIITYGDMVYSASAAVTPGSWGTNSAKFNKLSSVVFSADIDDITELYEGMKIAVAFTTRGGTSNTKLNINELGEHYLYKNINTNITTASFASGCVLYFTYFNDNWRSDQESNSTYNAMVDAYVSLGATATNISASCTNFSARPGSTINVTFPRDYTAVSAKNFRAGTTTYQPLYLNGSATSNTNYFIPSGTWPVYYDGNNWYLWTDGSIQFSAIRGTVIDGGSTLSAGTDLIIENNIISVNTDGTANSAYMAFVEGSGTIADGQYSHAEGLKTYTSGGCNHAEGCGSSAISWEAHAEGNYTLASGVNSHAECSLTTAAGVNSHAEGYKTFASYQAHSEGDSTSAFGNHSHTEGQYTVAQNNCSHAEGQETSALRMHTHTEGGWTLADGNAAHAEGYYTSATGYASHTEGYKTNATNSMSHAEGNLTSAVGEMSHAEGSQVLAQGMQSHAEGNMTTAYGTMTHAEGVATFASGGTSHAEGAGTSALDYASHSEGYCTIAASQSMHAGGKYNKTSSDALFVLGNGSADSARSDAFIVTSGGLASAVTLATSGISDIESAISALSSSIADTSTLTGSGGITVVESANSAIIVGPNLDSYVKYTDIQYAIGSANTATGSTTSTYSVALGKSNSAYNSFVIGNYNKGKESHILGDSNSGINSYIVGNSCTGTESYLFGKELSGRSWGIELGDFGDTGYPVIVGRQNATKSNAYFVVGCGNTLGNADAFIVSSNKIASAADFLAGNNVSLSSLTGLATTSWVNNTFATKSVAQQYANFAGGNGIVVAGDLTQTKTINSNLTEVPIQDGTGIHIYEDPNDAYVSISVKPEVFIYQTNAPVSRNTDGQFGITLQAGSYSTFNTKNGTVGVNNTDFTGLDANKLYNYNVKVGVTASSPGTVSLYGPNWNNSESYTSAYVSTNSTLELDCYIKGVTSFNVSGAGLNSNIGAGIIEASITEVCDV